MTTGLLAIIAASIEWYLGYRHGVVTLGDAAHAASDGLADFVGILTVAVSITWVTRRLGDHLIAILLGFSVAGILYITYQKFIEGYDLSPQLIVIAGLVGVSINSLRAYMFYRGWARDPNSTRVGLLIHASADALHSLIVLCIGVFGVLVSFIGISSHQLIYADTGLSVILSLYIASMVPGVWKGEHNHKIFEWTLGRFDFFQKILGQHSCTHSHEHHSDHHH